MYNYVNRLKEEVYDTIKCVVLKLKLNIDINTKGHV